MLKEKLKEIVDPYLAMIPVAMFVLLVLYLLSSDPAAVGPY